MRAVGELLHPDKKNASVPSLFNLGAAYTGSNTGEENRAWYQMYAHALDIAAFIPSVTVRSMTIDVLQKMTYWKT